MAEAHKPRVLRQIVFGYTVECFPGMLILGHNQLKRMMARAGFDVKTKLAPLNALPADTDILFVPTELADAARRAAPRCRVEVLQDFLNHPTYKVLIQRLNEGVEWTAERVVERQSSESGGEIVTYRGYERIE